MNGYFPQKNWEAVIDNNYLNDKNKEDLKVLIKNKAKQLDLQNKMLFLAIY